MNMAKKITNPQELMKFRDQVRSEIDLRGDPKEIKITVHMGTCGIAAGAREIVSQLGAELLESKVSNVTLRQSGCAGFCDREPMMTLTDATGTKWVYGGLDKQKVHEIVQSHIIGGSPVANYLITT
jgi:NADP-reducing hydrogenase subunit HndB